VSICPLCGPDWMRLVRRVTAGLIGDAVGR